MISKAQKKCILIILGLYVVFSIVTVGPVIGIVGEGHSFVVEYQDGNGEDFVIPRFWTKLYELDIPFVIWFMYWREKPAIILSVLLSRRMNDNGEYQVGKFLLKDLENLEFTKVEYLSTDGSNYDLLPDLPSLDATSGLLVVEFDKKITPGDRLFLEGLAHMKDGSSEKFNYRYKVKDKPRRLQLSLRILQY